ncbi:hypothetical protein Bbelb_091590 [Branchiostoma belcheri]|nr:hypothetical protein Bbelb_091590 [Branchiostoma belcheri]
MLSLRLAGSRELPGMFAVRDCSTFYRILPGQTTRDMRMKHPMVAQSFRKFWRPVPVRKNVTRRVVHLREPLMFLKANSDDNAQRMLWVEYHTDDHFWLLEGRGRAVVGWQAGTAANGEGLCIKPGSDARGYEVIASTRLREEA